MRIAARVFTGLLSIAALTGAVSTARAGEKVLSYAPFVAPEVAIVGAIPSREALPRFEPPRGRVCYNPAETRDRIAAHRLTEPFRALKLGRAQGDALRARLCKWKQDEFVYEIAVLRRDGRIVHIYMNAQNGENVGDTTDPDKH